MESVAFIDWISYSKPNTLPLIKSGLEFDGLSKDVCQEWMGYLTSRKSKEYTYDRVKPNRPFRDAVQAHPSGARIEWGGGSDFVLCSLPGKACAILREEHLTQTVLKNNCSSVSRIDISMDLRTLTSPFDFCNKREKGKFRNGVQMFSDEGQTQYVGSWSSDRFARVYRYNPPHVRSDFLRVEHVFKGKQAKVLAAKLVNTLPQALIKAVGEVYGWHHPDWLLALIDSGEPETVSWYKAEMREGKTLQWLQEVCCPSILRLVREGEITDLRAWLDENLWAKIDDGRESVIENPPVSEG